MTRRDLLGVNVEFAQDGAELLLRIDLTERHGDSRSGKSTVIASTKGPARLPGGLIVVNLTVWESKP